MAAFMSVSFGNDVFDSMSQIQDAQAFADMPNILHAAAIKAGFESFAFLDNSAETSIGGRVITTVSQAWHETYAREGFAQHDPCLHKVVGSNTPFFWSDMEIPSADVKRDLSRLTMTAARDVGYQDGLVIPLHMADAQGGRMVNCCGFFWTEGSDDMRRSLGPRGPSALRMLAAAWAEKLADLDKVEVSRDRPEAAVLTGLFGAPPRLTSREIDVLSWAARGKTADETAVILNLGRETVRTHMTHACRKMDASNKTHAVAIAVYRRLIQP